MAYVRFASVYRQFEDVHDLSTNSSRCLPKPAAAMRARAEDEERGRPGVSEGEMKVPHLSLSPLSVSPSRRQWQPQLPQPPAFATFGLSIVKPRPVGPSWKSIFVPSRCSATFLLVITATPSYS